MGEFASGAILYVGSDSEREQAVSILEDAQVPVDVRQASTASAHSMTYGTPVLFALSNRYEGLEGIRVFLENAKVLGYHR